MKPFVFAPATLGLVLVIVGGVSAATPTSDYRFSPAQIAPFSSAELTLIAKPAAQRVSTPPSRFESLAPGRVPDRFGSGINSSPTSNSADFLRFDATIPTGEKSPSSSLVPKVQSAVFAPR